MAEIDKIIDAKALFDIHCYPFKANKIQLGRNQILDVCTLTKQINVKRYVDGLLIKHCGKDDYIRVLI